MAPVPPPFQAVPPQPASPGTAGPCGHRHLLTCRHHVCCCLPCSGSSSSSSSSSPPPSSSSSLPLPAAWGSLWRFIHSCLPIGPSAFPCLPEAERVTPRPFPATFCCHRAALPQPGGAAGPGHAWATTGRGRVPQRGVGGGVASVGTAPTRFGGVTGGCPAPVTEASGRPQGFPRCPPSAPSHATLALKWGLPAERARVGSHPPGLPSPPLSHSAPLPPRCLRTRGRTAALSAERCPIHPAYKNR